MSNMQLAPASEEQQLIIDVVSTKTTNILVDAVAGSGKTTLIMHIARANPDNKILVITYNKDLKAESRERASKLGLDNIEIHTYHSLCWRYYGARDYTDNGIDLSIKAGIKLRPRADYIVLDESQDITPLLYRLFVDFYKNCKPQSDIECPIIMIIGDKFQTIYGFRGADSRYLTRADQKYNLNSLPWNEYTMSTSFRISCEMARFINNAMLKHTRLVGCSNIPGSVVYLKTNVFKTGSVDQLIKKYKDNEIMIIAPSIKSENSPVRKLANYLSSLGRKLYVPVSDDAVPDLREATGKVICITIHQSKGLERNVVVVYGFDDTYFKYFAKQASPDVCPNTLYVACTRAKKLLVMVQHEQNNPLTFLDIDAVQKHANVLGNINMRAAARPTPVKTRNMSVTQLTSHLSFDLVKELKKYYTTELLAPKSAIIEVPDVLEIDNMIEGVSELTGIAVSMLLAKHLGCDYPNMEQYTKATDNILHMANLYNADFSGYIHKLNQIKTYDWMSEKQANDAVLRTLEILEFPETQDVKFEKPVFAEIDKVAISGRMDMVDDAKRTAYEFKFVENLQDEHFLQLAVYMYLSNYEEYRLLNIKTGEMHKIHADRSELLKMIETILYHKNRGEQKISDEEFLVRDIPNADADENIKNYSDNDSDNHQINLALDEETLAGLLD